MRRLILSRLRLPEVVTERLEARFACLTARGGPVDQAQAIVGLVRAVADGVADELTRRLPFRMLYVPQPIPAPAWQPPTVQAAPVSVPVPTPVSVAVPVPSPVEGYEGMTVVALKDEARRRGLPVRPRVKKAELIAALKNA